MTRLRWDHARVHRGFELAFTPEKKPAKGGWTHIKRQPVKVYTAEERAAWLARHAAAA